MIRSDLDGLMEGPQNRSESAFMKAASSDRKRPRACSNDGLDSAAAFLSGQRDETPSPPKKQTKVACDASVFGSSSEKTHGSDENNYVSRDAKSCLADMAKQVMIRSGEAAAAASSSAPRAVEEFPIMIGEMHLQQDEQQQQQIASLGERASNAAINEAASRAFLGLPQPQHQLAQTRNVNNINPMASLFLALTAQRPQGGGFPATAKSYVVLTPSHDHSLSGMQQQNALSAGSTRSGAPLQIVTSHHHQTDMTSQFLQSLQQQSRVADINQGILGNLGISMGKQGIGMGKQGIDLTNHQTGLTGFPHGQGQNSQTTAAQTNLLNVLAGSHQMGSQAGFCALDSFFSTPLRMASSLSILSQPFGSSGIHPLDPSVLSLIAPSSNPGIAGHSGPPFPSSGFGSSLLAGSVAAVSDSVPASLPASIAQEEDSLKLSPPQVLLRNQIEVFQASEEDVKTHIRGRNKPITLGQVGIRCRHCARLPVSRKQKGSTYFPASLSGLYQAAQNMNTTHMQNGLCAEMPEHIKKEFADIFASKTPSSGAGRPYWALSASKKLGLVDAGEAGIRFIRDPHLRSSMNA